LFGGQNVFAYPTNPTGWVDVLGLKPKINTPALSACCRLIRMKLQQHANAANAQVGNSPNNGLSPAQIRDVQQPGNAWKYNMHYGTQVDAVFKEMVRADSFLMSKVRIPMTGDLRPDITTQEDGCPWFDLTTDGGWGSHVRKYSPRGKGQHIKYKAPKRSF
jgi:ABC-type uncharacterized transport system involved in gliding motility auxiliary subunit